MTRTQDSEVDVMLKKVDEIRSFFKFGDEVIPFLGDLFKFLQEIMPLMAQVSQSLQDSTHTLPTAADRIADVTKSTEMATHEILDKLDSISGKLHEIHDDNPDQGKKVDGIQENVNDIIFALQFQDITSQKLEHANRILEAILEKFTRLFSSLERLGLASSFGEFLLQHNVDSEEDLKQHSEEFQSKTEDVIHSTTFSQDDIDSLFD